MILTPEKADQAVDFLRVLANTMRLRILELLTTGEYTVGEIEGRLSLKQPALSQQLAELRDSGLVSTRRHAKSVYYRLSDDRAKLLVHVIKATVAGGQDQEKAISLLQLRGASSERRPSPGDSAMFAIARRQT